MARARTKVDASPPAPAPLSPAAVDLLLILLEQREPCLSAAAAELDQGEADALIAVGLLVDDGWEPVAMVPDEDGPTPAELFWSDLVGGWAYFSPTAGPVAVPNERLRRWRVSIEAVHVILRDSLGIPARVAPMPLADGALWELGTAFLDRRGAATPIWFARRLATPEGQRKLRAAMAARPHPRTIVVLTSGRAERLLDVMVPGAVVVAWRDVLVSPGSLAVCPDLLTGRLRGVPDPLAAGPLELSADGTTLLIHGQHRIVLRSRRHIAAIRMLVAAYARGDTVPVLTLTPLGNLSRLFGGKRWAELSPYLASERGRWRFEV